MKHITLCADDYGQNTAISQAIITLIEKKRLSATSCMTNSYYWLSHAKWLLPFIDQIDIGLHFNLTEFKALSKEWNGDFSPLPQLILRAYLHQLKPAVVEAELHAQLDQFEAGLGRMPDFIDGHQHIHQLPGVRDAILAVYEKRLRKTAAYIRMVADPSAFWHWRSSAYLKNCVIQLCGAFTFKRALLKQKIPHNTSFAGAYEFATAADFAKFFPQFLVNSKDGGLIMCHPGNQNFSSQDKIAAARYEEYQYFLSSQFLADCAATQVVLQKCPRSIK